MSAAKPRNSEPSSRNVAFPGWRIVLAPLASAAAAAGGVCARAGRRVFAMAAILTATVQWLAEDFTTVCGHEALLLLLVTLSLTSLDAPALAYIAAAGYGMFWRDDSAERLPRALVPAASCTLLAQYVCFVLRATGSAAAPQSGPVFKWLGLCPTGTSLTLLLSTLGIAAARLNSAAWHTHVLPAAEAEATPAAADAAVHEALLPPVRPAPAAHALYFLICSLPAQAAGTAVILAPSQPYAAELSSDAPAPAAARLTCKPHWQRARGAAVHARSSWRWPDHLRFWFFRFSLDALMILVVALCCVQRDLIHAAYLALTLFLFRRREELRLRGNGLFVWMPLANFSFMVLLILFQVPWGAFWGSEPLAQPVPPMHNLERCTFAHLLGLHRIQHAGYLGALALQPDGSGLPLLMWLAMQVRSSFCSNLNAAHLLLPLLHRLQQRPKL